MFAQRIDHKLLGTLCERIGVAFDIGHDPHKIFDRESKSKRRTYRNCMARIAQHVRNGGSLADAMRAQGNYFPQQFVQMIDVGESTGRLEIVMERLSKYYRGIANQKTEFWNSVTWPIVQLILAVIVVGVLIYVPSVVAPEAGAAADLLGFGLFGWDGLVAYLSYVATAVVVLLILWFLAHNGRFGFLVHWLAYVPWMGRMITIFPEARFVQTLSLALESGLDTWNAVSLSFKSASSPMFRSKADSAKKAIRQGRELHEVLAETGLFAQDTIEAVELGEDTGKLPEVLDKQFSYLQVKASASLNRFSHLASTFIWIAIASLLIFIIFRVFSNYLSSIENVDGSMLPRSVLPAPGVR